ncbi:GLUG motif-containing protein [Sedimentisphaera salicampi]|uniref:GLUG motif-containing protein n=1 Tax=Sedimentisphaera salicampi TaxID=1941349 RepID=UPI000B9A3899|nr:GLUG motif-containing protein [Sedimentisphaera salicampi]OXU15096.1 GLUG domain protein [Sedimentisphaera salicampi]
MRLKLCVILLVPAVCVYAQLPGEGTPESPWVIDNASDFDAYRRNASFWTGTAVLAGDIDLSAYSPYSRAPISPDTDTLLGNFQGTPFSGTLDGQGFSITGLSINPYTASGKDHEFLGLVGKIASSGVVKNISVELEINPAQNCGSFCAGAIAGKNLGLIRNCICHAEITLLAGTNVCIGGITGYNEGDLERSMSSGFIKCGGGSNRVGGAAGFNSAGDMLLCSSKVNCVLGDSSQYIGGLIGDNMGAEINQCWAGGDITRLSTASDYPDYAGGLLGRNYSNSSIKNCFATGEVDGDEYAGGLAGRHENSGIRKCYSTGKVTGSLHVGGLVGKSDTEDPDVYDSFWDTETSGRPTSSGGTGKTTAQLQQESTFAGWDFIAVWRISQTPFNEPDYPKLRFYNPADLDMSCEIELSDFVIFAQNWLSED